MGWLIAAADSVSILGLFRVPLETAKFWVSALGFAGTATAVTFAGLQYRRGEKWRRGEFVAKEIKEFEANPEVRNVLRMIDWAERPVNLHCDPNLPPEKWPYLGRKILWRALLPHEIKGGDATWIDPTQHKRVSDGEGTPGLFSEQEARIRDTFDAFFNGLERLATFTSSNLVTAQELKPYLHYWIDDLATNQGGTNSAKWRCAMLTYIHVYGFAGVKKLFLDFGYDISPEGPIFQRLRREMQDEKLFAALAHQARRRGSLTTDADSGG